MSLSVKVSGDLDRWAAAVLGVGINADLLNWAALWLDRNCHGLIGGRAAISILPVQPDNHGKGGHGRQNRRSDHKADQFEGMPKLCPGQTHAVGEVFAIVVGHGFLGGFDISLDLFDPGLR